jgi:hypothetical protein
MFVRYQPATLTSALLGLSLCLCACKTKSAPPVVAAERAAKPSDNRPTPANAPETTSKPPAQSAPAKLSATPDKPTAKAIRQERRNKDTKADPQADPKEDDNDKPSRRAAPHGGASLNTISVQLSPRTATAGDTITLNYKSDDRFAKEAKVQIGGKTVATKRSDDGKTLTFTVPTGTEEGAVAVKVLSKTGPMLISPELTIE